jgi:hypothetical protein
LTCALLLFSGGTLAKLVYFEPTDEQQLEQRSPEDQQVKMEQILFIFVYKCEINYDSQ